jgi:hypothetical protein
MIWALASHLHPPRFWVRLVFDSVCVVLVSWLIFLAVFDDTPPYQDAARGTIRSAVVAPGALQEIQWEIIQQRHCAEVRIRRALLSAESAIWASPLADAVPPDWSNDPLPIVQHIIAQPILVPLSTPLGRVFYRVDVIAACNWLQAMLPEHWWIHQHLPVLTFTVE